MKLEQMQAQSPQNMAQQGPQMAPNDAAAALAMATHISTSLATPPGAQGAQPSAQDPNAPQDPNAGGPQGQDVLGEVQKEMDSFKTEIITAVQKELGGIKEMVQQAIKQENGTEEPTK